jgi:succinate dehydrogenase / fumarate reductase membrane anchor subunit
VGVNSAARRPRLVTFVVMRATALLLTILVLGHFAVTHLVTDVAQTDSSFVLRRWSSALWLAWDWTMLATALVHAGAGLWLLVDEQTGAVSVRRRLRVAVGATVAVLLSLGTVALAVASTRAA